MPEPARMPYLEPGQDDCLSEEARRAAREDDVSEEREVFQPGDDLKVWVDGDCVWIESAGKQIDIFVEEWDKIVEYVKKETKA